VHRKQRKEVQVAERMPGLDQRSREENRFLRTQETSAHQRGQLEIGQS
jgi:hypothetical protein